MKSKKQSKKGEKMSLRKFVSLLLLVAFTLTTVPAQAATLASSATLPTVVQESGTEANGANRDVVPVTIKVDQVSLNTLEFMLVDFQGTTGASNGATLSITANGKLSIGGNGQILGGSNEKALIVTPPTGTRFVGLTHDGYETNGVTLVDNGAMVTENVGGTVANNVLPGLGNNGNALIARVITAAGPSSYFGSGVTVPIGSIVAYFATGDNDTGANPVGTSFNLTNFGLSVAPTGESSGTLSGNLSLTYEEPGAGALIDEALGSSLADAVTLEIAQIGTGAKLEFGMAANEDSEPNTVLGVLLSSAGNGVTIHPAAETSSSSTSTLIVDTDALYIRAKEASTGVYYQTPFATSEYTGSVIDVNGNVSIFNRALTNTSSFPNTSDALISVDFAVQDPTTSAAYASTDASIDVTKVSVSLVGEDIDTDIRGAITQANGGFLGSIIETIDDNGGTAASEANTGIAVLYNGDSATSPLVVVDATSIDYSAPTAAMGLDATSAYTVVPSAVNGNGDVSVLPFVDGIFEGVFVSDEDASDSEGRAALAISGVNGTISGSVYKIGTVPNVTGWASGKALITPSEVTVRLTDTTNGANAWFVITGNHAGDDMTDAPGDIRVGPSNSATFGSGTGNGAVVQSTDDSAVGIADNAIAIARLSGNTLQILPIINHIDGERDAIIIRPEISLTLKTTTARTNGAKVIATANGNNLASTAVTVAQVTGTGTLENDILVKAVPINGSMNRLMVENGIDAFNGRALLNLASLTGGTTSLDEYEDLIDNGNGLVLDETLPTLFCGGTIGNGEKGANAVVSQSKPMAILITENGQAGASTGVQAFSTVADNNNTVIRITLPSGWDINNFSATQSKILGVFSSGGFSSAPATGKFDIQEINSDAGVSQAYVDLNGFTLNTGTTVEMNRAIAIVFKQDALVAPVGVSDFTATVSLMFDNGTSTTADDTLLQTIGTVELGTECGTGLTLAFCDDKFSAGSTVNSDLESDLTSNGANLTTFTMTPTGSLRMVQPTSSESVNLPDLCVGEGSPDLFAVGADIEGGFAAQGELYIIASANTGSTADIHFDGAGVESATDNSLTLGTPSIAGAFGGAGDDLMVAVSDAGNTLNPDEVTSRIRIRGVTMEGPTTGVNPAQDLLAIFVDPNDTGAAIGDEFPMSYFEDSTNGDAIVGRTTSTDDNGMIGHFYNADTLDDTSIAINGFDTSNDSSLEFAFTNTTAPIITNAVTNILDDDNYDQLSSDTVISVDVSDITGSTNKKAVVSAQAGSLEPKSTILATLSGSGSSDSVTVPVLSDGSFQLTITAATTQQIVLQQLPSSSRTDLPPQIVYLDVEDQNVEPRLLSASVSDIGLSMVTAKGEVPVVFTVTATGKVNGDAFVPTADQLKLGENTVYAVPGTTDQFIAVQNFFKASGDDLTATLSDGTTTTVALSGSGLSTEDPTLGGRPILRKVKNNKKDYLVVKGKRLRNNGFFGIVKTDGSYEEVDMRSRTKGDKRKNRLRSEDTYVLPDDALFGVYSVPGRGVDTLLLD